MSLNPDLLYPKAPVECERMWEKTTDALVPSKHERNLAMWLFFMGSGIVKCADVISLKDLKAFACVCLRKTHRGVAFVCLYDCLCYHRYLHVEVYIHTYISTYMHIDRQTKRQKNKHSHINIHTYMQNYTLTHTHTNRYTYIQTYTHQNIQTDTCVCIPTTPALPPPQLTDRRSRRRQQTVPFFYRLGKDHGPRLLSWGFS